MPNWLSYYLTLLRMHEGRYTTTNITDRNNNNATLPREKKVVIHLVLASLLGISVAAQLVTSLFTHRTKSSLRGKVLLI